MSASAASTLFVQNLYSTILLRTGSTGDVNSWATLLDSGLLTQSQELSAFETSPEAVNFVDPAVRMYQTFFGRAPDSNGFNGWVNDLRNGTITMQGLAEGFSHSTEFTTRYGTNPNFSAFVTALYQNVLNRAPDAPGLAGWVALLTSGQFDFAQVALGFSNSTEFINNSTAAINTWLTQADVAANVGGTVSPPGSPVYPDQGMAIPGILPGGAGGGNYVLTTGIDNATATNFFASETYFITDGHGPTLNPGDTLNGAGSNNTLTVTDLTAGAATDNIPAGVTLNNIQNVVLNSSGNTAGSGFSTVGIAGVKTLSVTTAGVGGDVVAAANGASGTAITVNHAAFAGGGVIVLGGTTVAINENSAGNVLVGLIAGGSVPAPANVATGTIAVTTNSTGGGNLNIVGGTNVTATATSTSYTGSIDIGNTGFAASPNPNTGNSPSGALANPTGAISVTENTGGEAGGAITIFGGTTVNVSTGASDSDAITIGDTGATLKSNEATGAITVNDAAAITYDGIAGSGHNSFIAAPIKVYGGTSVSVTSNGGGTITIGHPGNSTASAALPTGAVTVVETGISNAHHNGAVTVDGGTDISVMNAGGSVTVGGAPVGAFSIDPSATITITETLPTTFSNFAAISADGGTSVNVTALGQDVTIGGNGAPTGAVTVSQSAVLTGQGLGSSSGTVFVAGGTTVSVTTTGGSVTVGGATGVPSGAVTIKDTFSGANNSGNDDSFTVLGGTTVTITSNPTGSEAGTNVGAAPLLNATGNALLNAAQDPTGNVTINNSETNGVVVTYGSATTNVYTNGATTVSITGGTVTNVVDVESTLASGGAGAGKAVGTSTLATVVLDGDGTAGGEAAATAVNSDVLSSLSLLDLSNGSHTTAVTVTDNTAGHALNLVVGNIAASAVGASVVTVTDAVATSANISDSGKVSANGKNTLTLAGASIATVNFANSVAMSATVAGLGALTTINDSGAGSLALGDLSGLAGLGKIVSTGSGAISVTINPGTTSFTGGSGGGNVLTIDQNSNINGLGNPDILNGGSSSGNTIVANYAAGALDTGLGSTASITGFQTLGFGANATSTAGTEAYDATGFGGLTLGATAGDILATNVSAGATLSITATNANAITYQLHKDTANDTIPVIVGNDGPQFVGSNSISATIVAPKIENLNITSKGWVTKGNINTLTFQDSLAASVTTSGDQALQVNLNSDLGPAILSSGSSIGVINASAATGPTTFSASLTVAANVGVAVSASGVTATGGAGLLTVSGALGDAGQVSAADEASVAQLDTITIGSSSGVKGDQVAATINGTTYTYTLAAADTTALIATGLAGKIAAAGFTVAAVGSTVTIQDNTAGVLFSSSVSVTSKSGLTTASDATTTAFLNGNLSKAVDSITTGSGGGTITLGTGGSWNAATTAYDTGSETVNLTASANAVDKLVVIDGATVTNNGSKGGVTGFVVSPSGATADQVEFITHAGNGGVSDPKTVLANNAVSTAVATTDVGALTPILLGKATLANLTWTSSNGVITFGATGGHSVSEFTTGQLVAAAEVIVDESTGAASPNQVAAFVAGGNTYVVASGATGTATTAVNDNSVVELIGVSGITGFGTTAGQGTIVDQLFSALGVPNLTLQNAGNGGSLVSKAFDDTGFAADTFTTGGKGVTNTFNNLAPSAVLTTAGGGIDLGNLATTQTGAAGANSLTVQFTTNDTLDSATLAGDNTVILVSAGGGTATVTSLVDPGNTLAALVIAGGAETITSITDSGLFVISGSTDNAVVSLGGAWAGAVPPTTALSQSNLSITLGDGADFISASGGADKITTGIGASHINAIGSSDAISVNQIGNVAAGHNFIIATGATDTINIGNGGGNTVTATGVGDTINEQTIVSGGVPTSSVGGNTFVLGSNAVLTLTNAGAGAADNVDVSADVAGSAASFGFTTIKGATQGHVHITMTSLLGGVTSDSWLGDGAFGSEVNVSSAATLTAAVNLAASQAAAKFHGVIAANSAFADWFQFGGNTYIVDAVNPTAGLAPHATLGASDVVVELVGLVSPSGGYAGHVLSI